MKLHHLYEKSSKRNIPLMIFLLTFEKIQPRELDDSCQWSPGQSRQYIILRVQKNQFKKGPI